MTLETAGTRILAGRWVLPMDSPPIENGGIEVTDGRITAVYTAEDLAAKRSAIGSGSATHGVAATEDFGESIICPGFINLHTHVDWTAGELCNTDAPTLFDWIPSLILPSRNWTQDDFARSADAGVKRIAGSGTTCVFDSSYSGQAAIALSQNGLRGLVGLELFGVEETTAEENWNNWLKKHDDLLSGASIAKRVQVTVAPHAPYSVCPSLLKRASNWAEQNGIPYTVHLSETEQEFSWVRDGNNYLDNFLERTHYIVDKKATSLQFRACGKTPPQLMDEHKLLRDGLVAAHCVHTPESDAQLLAQRSVAVAHCPRSNARLRAGLAPVRRLLETGVRLGFGTDSAASTDSLSVLSEARFSWNANRAVDPSFTFDSEKAIRMLTIEAAKAIGLSHLIGSLTPGKQADVAIFNIVSDGPYAAKRPYDALLYGKVVLHELLVDGVKVAFNPLY